jgi:hypothetical protein
MAGSSKVRGRKGKLGKKKHWIAAYFSNGQHLWNKARKLTRHLRTYPEDKVAQEARKVALAGLSHARTKAFNEQYKLAD